MLPVANWLTSHKESTVHCRMLMDAHGYSWMLVDTRIAHCTLYIAPSCPQHRRIHSSPAALVAICNWQLLSLKPNVLAVSFLLRCTWPLVHYKSRLSFLLFASHFTFPFVLARCDGPTSASFMPNSATLKYRSMGHLFLLILTNLTARRRSRSRSRRRGRDTQLSKCACGLCYFTLQVCFLLPGTRVMKHR